MKNLVFLFLFLSATFAQAQFRISGKVTDAKTGEALPFVSIYIKNASIGTTTDLNGTYNIKLTKIPDSLTVSFVGYLTQSKAVNKDVATQVINVALETSAVSLKEILITPGENPAFRIMRQVMAHKDANDKRKLKAFQFEAYTKMQFSADNLTQTKKKIGIKSAVNSLVDTSLFVKSEFGGKVLPFFISEALSDYYYNRDPKKYKESIKASKITGIGVQDGSLIAQVIGTSFQDYNFYQNWVSVLRKDFISPLADGWKGAYEYELEDSLWVGDTWCYQLKINQKRPQDLAFNGYIWIADSSFALRKIDVTISKTANINFVESIHLVQESMPVESGAWLPIKTIATMKVARMSANKPGVVAKVTTTNRNFVVNKNMPVSFFDQPIEMKQKSNALAESYWEMNRPDTLSAADKQVYAAIDSIKSSPKVEHLTNIITVLATGYKKVGKISLGPYPYFYANNNIEGHRFQIGFKTNIDFSNKWELSGYGAYGTLDNELKYSGTVRYIFSRKKWSEAAIMHRSDIQRVGLMSDKLGNSPFLMGFSRFGNLRRPFATEETSAYLQRDILPGVTQRIGLSSKQFKPLFDFGYYNEIGENAKLVDNFTTTEISFSTRYSNNQAYVTNDNDRYALSTSTFPVYNFKYTAGLNNALGADLAYQRIDVGVSQQFVLGKLGKTFYRIEAGKIFCPVPYPLLEVHIGNETPFYYQQTFNLMDVFEFASDSYASLHHEQYFEGLLFNRLPLIKKLRWRLLTTTNILYGNLSSENRALLSPVGVNGAPQSTFRTLERKPYAEIGYGIENIFRFLRVDAFHRLTYLDQPGTRKFGLKFSATVKL